MNSRRKGAEAERELAGMFRDRGYPARRGQQYCGVNGDADVVGVPYLHIECKAVEKLNIHEAMKQSQRDARGEELATVIFKKNYKPWLVCLSFEQFMLMYESFAKDMKAKDEMNYEEMVKQRLAMIKQKAE